MNNIYKFIANTKALFLSYLENEYAIFSQSIAERKVFEIMFGEVNLYI